MPTCLLFPALLFLKIHLFLPTASFVGKHSCLIDLLPSLFWQHTQAPIAGTGLGSQNHDLVQGQKFEIAVVYEDVTCVCSIEPSDKKNAS